MKKQTLTLQKGDKRTKLLLQRTRYHILTPNTSEGGSESLKETVVDSMLHPKGIGVLISETWLDAKGNKHYCERRLIFGTKHSKEEILEVCREKRADHGVADWIKKKSKKMSFFYSMKNNFLAYSPEDNAHPFPNLKDILMSDDWD